MSEMTVVIEIKVNSNGEGVKKYKFAEGENVDVVKYEATRLEGNTFAIKYDDAKVLEIEVIEENGDSQTLASVELNEETERIIANYNDMKAPEVFALIAKYPKEL